MSFAKQAGHHARAAWRTVDRVLDWSFRQREHSAGWWFRRGVGLGLVGWWMFLVLGAWLYLKVALVVGVLLLLVGWALVTSTVALAATGIEHLRAR